MSDKDTFLMAHLMRRAGFGASLGEIKELVKNGYDETVDHMLDDEPNIPVSEYRVMAPMTNCTVKAPITVLRFMDFLSFEKKKGISRRVLIPKRLITVSTIEWSYI